MKPKQRSKHSRAASGFTLIEVLVVVTIIITLAALSFMGVRTMRQSAQSARCADNLRTWGTAFHGYAADNNGNVQWNGWASIGSAQRYYETYIGGNGITKTALVDGKAVFHTEFYRRCPAQKWDGKGNVPVGYGMVRHDPKDSVSTYKLNTASNPSQLLLMMDANILYLRGPGETLPVPPHLSYPVPPNATARKSTRSSATGMFPPIKSGTGRTPECSIAGSH